MALQQQPASLSYEAYTQLGDTLRGEVIGGVFLGTPAPSRLHQRAVLRIAATLLQDVERKGLGEVHVAPFDVVLRAPAPAEIFQPDVVVVLEANLGRLEDRGVMGPPDLVVEVLSPATARRDLLWKRRRYEEHGVAELWLVQADLGRIEIYRLQGGAYGQPFVHEADAQVQSPLFPGLSWPVAELLGLPPERAKAPTSAEDAARDL